MAHIMFKKSNETPYSIQNFDHHFKLVIGKERGVWLGASASAHCCLNSDAVLLPKQTAHSGVECIVNRQQPKGETVVRYRLNWEAWLGVHCKLTQLLVHAIPLSMVQINGAGRLSSVFESPSNPFGPGGHRFLIFCRHVAGFASRRKWRSGSITAQLPLTG